MRELIFFRYRVRALFLLVGVIAGVFAYLRNTPQCIYLKDAPFNIITSDKDAYYYGVARDELDNWLRTRRFTRIPPPTFGSTIIQGIAADWYAESADYPPRIYVAVWNEPDAFGADTTIRIEKRLWESIDETQKRRSVFVKELQEWWIDYKAVHPRRVQNKM